MKFVIVNISEIKNTTWEGPHDPSTPIDEIVEKEKANPFWSVSFEELDQESLLNAKKNNDNTKCVLSYSGDCPDFLEGKITYTAEEIEQEMLKSEWN